MTTNAYYNEFNPEAAAWLRELIRDGQIAPGEVDERSITEVRPSDLKGFAQCHFFAGIGVWSYALRQSLWPDSRPVWTGSCPCQPYSPAGKREGNEDERNLWPVWFELVRECKPACMFGEQVSSSSVIGKANGTGKNVWCDFVQTDLEGTSYAVAPFSLPASLVGAPHIRQRLWFVAERMGDTGSQPSKRNAGELPAAQTKSSGKRDPDGRHDNGYSDAGEVGRMENTDGANTSSEREQCGGQLGHIQTHGFNDGSRPTDSYNNFWSSADWLGCRDGKFRPVKPGSQCLVNGSANSMVSSSNPSSSEVENTKEARAMRLRGYGNAIVAPLAIEFITAYMEAA